MISLRSCSTLSTGPGFSLVKNPHFSTERGYWTHDDGSHVSNLGVATKVVSKVLTVFIDINVLEPKRGFDFSCFSMLFPCVCSWLVVWNMAFIFPYIGNFIIPTDFHIFQRGRSTTNQYHDISKISDISWYFLSQCWTCHIFLSCFVLCFTMVFVASAEGSLCTLRLFARAAHLREDSEWGREVGRDNDGVHPKMVVFTGKMV